MPALIEDKPLPGKGNKRAAFIYSRGRLARLEDARKGIVATEFFYGSIEMERHGVEVAHFEIDEEGPVPPAGRWLDWLHRHRCLPSKVTAALAQQLWRLSPALNSFDVIIATTSGGGFGLGLLKALGRIRPPVIALYCGIINYPPVARKKWLNRLALKRTRGLLFGEGEVAGTRELYGVDPTVNLFGVDTGFWRPNADQASEGNYVLSVGNDVRRDYETLLAAARVLEIPFRIVTRRDLGDRLPGNVEVLHGDWHAASISDRDLRELYRNAKMIVVPLHDSPQPSGQSVCLQAMACGKPVVLTSTRGLWSRSSLADGENLLFVPPQDENELVRAIHRLNEDPELCHQLGSSARRLVCEEFNIERFADHLQQVIMEVR